MSHDRGCFICYEDRKSDCGERYCPYFGEKKEITKMELDEEDGGGVGGGGGGGGGLLMRKY